MDSGLIPETETSAVPQNLDNNRYRGETKGGIRDGAGSYSYPNGGNELFTYNGQWKLGCKRGQGSFKVAGLSKYEGEFDAAGEITGYGKRSWDDGRVYEGNFICGEQNGHGRWTHNTTDWAGRKIDLTYEGDFVDNRRQGHGMYDDGAVMYTGPFSDHKFNGLGIARARDGAFTLNGSFVDNVVTGSASVTYTGAKQKPLAHLHCDSWKLGRPEGRGAYACADNSYIFSGSFLNGHTVDSEVASYVWSAVDRTALVKEEQEAAEAKLLAAGGKPGKKAPPKKGAAAEEDLMVPLGCNVGSITVRCGGQALIRAQAADAAAAAADPKTKKGKDAPVEGAKLPPPEPPAVMPMPCEHRRLLKLTLRSLLSPADGDVPASVSPPLPLWVRNDTQEEMAAAPTRFPVPAVVFEAGSLSARERPADFSGLGLPSALTLESGAAAAAVDTSGSSVLCNVLPLDASMAYSVSFDKWTGAQSRTAYFLDFKLDHSAILLACRERIEKERAARVSVAAERAAAIDAQSAAEAEAAGLEAPAPTEVPDVPADPSAWQGNDEVPVLSLSRELNGEEICSSALRLVLIVPRILFQPPAVALEEGVEEELCSNWTDCRYELRLRSTAESGVSEESTCALWRVGTIKTTDWQAVALNLSTGDECVSLASNGVMLKQSVEGKGGNVQAWLPEASPAEVTPELDEAVAEAKEGDAAEEAVQSEPTVIRHLVRCGGPGFAGAVKSQALCTATEACDMSSATGTYEAWRKREAIWSDYKRSNWYARAAEICAAEKSAVQDKVAAEAAAKAALLAAQESAAAAAAALAACESEAAARTPEDSAPDPDPVEAARADVGAADAAVTAAQEMLTAAEADLAAPVAPTIVPDVPHDYKIENAAWATLVCGQASFSHIAVPNNLPCGKYVLQIDDAVDSACVFTKEEVDEESAKTASQEKAAAQGEGGDGEEDEVAPAPEAVVELAPLSLASVRQMLRAVRPVPTYLQLVFTVTDPKAEVQ